MKIVFAGKGLSPGGKVGIAFAVIGVILAVAAAGIIYWRRRGFPARGSLQGRSSLANPIYQSSRTKPHVDLRGGGAQQYQEEDA